MKNSEYKVYIDMDGVVSNFDAQVNKISDGRYGSDPDYTKGNMWRDIKNWNDHVEPWFESLPKMDGADELIEFATSNFEHVEFLTATGSTPKDGPQQKRNWLQKNYPGLKAITVGASKEKAVYANPRSILVDDRTKAIDPWTRAGGVGILFTSSTQAIHELQKFL
jgi:hypothetical protein